MAQAATQERETTNKKEPLLKLKMLSHGTVEVKDLQAARRFYEEVLGMEVVQTSAVSLMMRHNSVTTIAAVQSKGGTSAGIFNHFGFDVDSEAEVNDAYERVLAVKDEYGVKKITKPAAQHGTYAFYIVDMDENYWEILTNPKGGYSYVFDMEDDGRGWRSQNQGRDRQERWKQQKSGA